MKATISRLSVCPKQLLIQDVSWMLDCPGHDGMVSWHVRMDVRLECQYKSPHVVNDSLNRSFSKPIRGRLARMR